MSTSNWVALQQLTGLLADVLGSRWRPVHFAVITTALLAGWIAVWAKG